MKTSKFLVAQLIALACCVCWGEGKALSSSPEDPVVKAARIQEKKRVFLGPKVTKPNSKQGTIAILSAQDKVSAGEFDAVLGMIFKTAKYDTRVSKIKAESLWNCSAFLRIKSDEKASVAVFVIDNSEMPVSLVAPEEHWAVVNISKLCAGLPENDLLRGRMLSARARREVVRALALASGGGSSQFENNIMNVTRIEDLDATQEFLPVDVLARVTQHLEQIGVTPAYERFYYIACKEGWAPAPTNEIEKAILQRVQEKRERGPSNPILITPKKK